MTIPAEIRKQSSKMHRIILIECEQDTQQYTYLWINWNAFNADTTFHKGNSLRMHFPVSISAIAPHKQHAYTHKYLFTLQFGHWHKSLFRCSSECASRKSYFIFNALQAERNETNGYFMYYSVVWWHDFYALITESTSAYVLTHTWQANWTEYTQKVFQLYACNSNFRIIIRTKCAWSPTSTHVQCIHMCWADWIE